VTGPATGIELGGRYRLQERIASGGMGTVWAAEDETLHRRVAVKVLNEGLSADERFTERFRREARAVAGVSHPNIAGVFDYGEEDGRPYIVMELIDGETLADGLARMGRLDPEETVRIGAAVADALALAHANGIVHRDVKPANIMLDRADHVRVMDFGIAATLEGSTGLTATGAVMGTSRYIAPEQADGERATPASDVYSLGVVLYEMLAGQPPFVRQTPVATAMAHIHERPRPLQEVRPDTPPALAEAVHHCLAKDPKRRPTATELAAELRSVEPASALTVPLAVGGDTEALPTPPVPGATKESGPEHAATRTLPLGLRVPPGTMSPERPRRERRARWLVGAAVIAIILLIIGLVASGSTERVRMPRLVGLPQIVARAKAEHLGLNPVITPKTSTSAAGTVIAQRPYAGRRVPKGIAVFLTVSTGQGAVTTPTSPSPPAPPPPHHEHKHGKGEHHGNGNGGGD